MSSNKIPSSHFFRLLLLFSFLFLILLPTIHCMYCIIIYITSFSSCFLSVSSSFFFFFLLILLFLLVLFVLISYFPSSSYSHYFFTHYIHYSSIFLFSSFSTAAYFYFIYIKSVLENWHAIHIFCIYLYAWIKTLQGRLASHM